MQPPAPLPYGLTLPASRLGCVWLFPPGYTPRPAIEQELLRQIIRRKLAAGTLPTDGIPRIWGGPGDNEVCGACEELITPVQFLMGGISRAADNQGLQLHVKCFYIWDTERGVPDRDASSPGAVIKDHALDGVHVLVVDDTDDSREMLRVALEYSGALVTTAASPEEATRVLATLRPHILVTDIAMPNDGVHLMREVRALAETYGIHVPVIAVTAYRGRREELLAEGFLELVEKPIDPTQLSGLLRRHAQRQT